MSEAHDAEGKHEPAPGEIKLLKALFPRRRVVKLNDRLRADLLLKVRQMLEGLEEKELKVISLRYGIGGGYAFEPVEIGAVMHLTSDKVTRLKNSALSKLRRFEHGFESFLIS